MTGTLGPSATLNRARAHSRAAQAAVVLLAWPVGTYAAWLGGDYGLGIGSVVGFGVVAGYLLVQQPSARAVVARGLVLLAGLVLVTPVFLNLPAFTGRHPGIEDPAGLVFDPGVYLMAVVFVILAAVLGGLAVLVDHR